MTNSIVAVVVTYNRKKLLCENLDHLIHQSFNKFDILVIDNNSTDGTYDAIADRINNNSNIRYINTGANLGGAGGFQYGIKKAYTLGYQYFWLMDDDSLPQENALSEILAAKKYLDEKNQQWGFLSSKVVWVDGSICKMNVQRATLTKNITDFRKPLIPAAIGSFVSLFIPATVVKELGLPIKEFFIWTDDWEYTRRISRHYSGYVVTTSVVMHKTKSNNGANIATDVEERIDRYKYAYRNECYLYNREGFVGVFHILARTPLHIFRVLRYSKSKRIKRISIILGSTIRGIFFHPKIEYVSEGKETC